MSLASSTTGRAIAAPVRRASERARMTKALIPCEVIVQLFKPYTAYGAEPGEASLAKEPANRLRATRLLPSLAHKMAGKVRHAMQVYCSLLYG